MTRPKALCVVVHFFGATGFTGGSTSPENRSRRQIIVQRTLAQIARLNAILDATVLVYGIKGACLVTPDVDVSRTVEPSHILWKAFDDTRLRLTEYDYFLFLEDDLLVPRSVVRRMMAAEREIAVDEILFPNRIEFVNGCPLAVDLIYADGGWTGYSRSWRGRTWHEAAHPHSGMLFMSRRQLAHVFETADFAKPVRGPKGYYMAAAFRHAHRDFRLLRERTLIPRHFVVHQDSWLARNMTRIPFTKALRAQLCIAFGSRAPI